MSRPVDTHYSATNLTFRRLRPDEEGLLAAAADIDAVAWGEHLRFAPEAFRARAANGYLLGAFDRDGGALAGTISTLRVPSAWIDAIGRAPTPAATWDAVTAHGTMATHVPTGDVLLCVAVTARQEREAPAPTPRVDALTAERLAALAARVVDPYLVLGVDYVVRFHARPKGGLEKGAELWRVVPEGRPADRDSLGYNVILRYPRLAPGLEVAPSAGPTSAGEGLVVAALDLATRLSGVSTVAAYSRPAELRRRLEQALAAVDEPTRLEAEPERVRRFAEAVRLNAPCLGEG